MNVSSQAVDLESALIERAKAQSEKCLSDARRTRDELLAAANERLRLREERETHVIRAFSERRYRQRVQAGEIKLRRELEWQRWRLIDDTIARLSARLAALVQKEGAYLPLLTGFLAKAAAEIGDGELVADLNEQDHRRLVPKWEAFFRDAGVGGRVRLAPQPLSSSGGVRVRDLANTVSVDFTIEARLARMQEPLRLVIAARLFPESELAREGAG